MGAKENMINAIIENRKTAMWLSAKEDAFDKISALDIDDKIKGYLFEVFEIGFHEGLLIVDKIREKDRMVIGYE